MTLTSLRERKKDRTRRELVDAALQLFVEQGFERTTVEEIAGACEVSPRTFFRYFGTKEEVLFHDGDGDAARQAQLLAALAARPADESPLLALRESVLLVVANARAEEPTMMRRRQVVAAHPVLRTRALEHQHRWEDGVVEALRIRTTGTTRSDMEIRLTVAAAAAALRTATDLWLESNGRRDLSKLIVEAFDALHRGFDLNSLPTAPKSRSNT